MKVKDKEGGPNTGIIVLVIIATVSLIVAVALYFWTFHNGLTQDNSEWAEFGDYFGGVLGPIFALLSFVAIIYTINLQRKDLQLQREELRN